MNDKESVREYDTRGVSEAFAKLLADESGTIYKDAYEDGVRYIIMRGRSSLCAYVGVPLDHPLAGCSDELVPLDVHGGLTYASEGRDSWPTGWFWYGWDYAHSGDLIFHDLDVRFRNIHAPSQNHAWTVEEVNKEMWSACYQFSKLKTLAEQIATKAMGWRKP